MWRRQRRPYRETLQATGCYVGRVVNRHSRVCADASAPFTGLPRRYYFRRPSGLRFRRHDGIYRSDVVQKQNQNPRTKPWNRTNSLPPVGPATKVKERDGRTTLFSSSAMSSGRLFLDRVGRHQSPSPLHRRDQNKSIAQSEGTIYHRTVRSVLTGCLSFRDRRISKSQKLPEIMAIL